MVWKTLHFDVASGTTWIPPGPTAWECKGVTLTMTLIMYNFLNFLPHLPTAHFSPFPRGSPSHLGEFSECIWTCSGAWLLGLWVLLRVSVWEPSDGPLLLAPYPGPLGEGYFPPRSPVTAVPSNPEPSTGWQVLSYCKNSRAPYCIFSANSCLISQFLLLFRRCSPAKYGRSPSLMPANTGTFKLWGEVCRGLVSGTCDLCSRPSSPPRPRAHKGPGFDFYALLWPSHNL